MLRQALTKLGEQTSLAIFFRKQKAAIREILLPIKEGEKILDLGCGTGEFAPLFPVDAYDGIDLDPANIAYAKRHYPNRFSVGDATRLAFPDNAFDKVLVAGVFHHLTDEDCKKSLAEMHRVLKPGGTALVMEDTRSKRIITSIMHRLDQGAFIRTGQEWDSIFSSLFGVKKRWTFDSGVCFYTGFVLTHDKH